MSKIYTWYFMLETWNISKVSFDWWLIRGDMWLMHQTCLLYQIYRLRKLLLSNIGLDIWWTFFSNTSLTLCLTTIRVVSISENLLLSKMRTITMFFVTNIYGMTRSTTMTTKLSILLVTSRCVILAMILDFSCILCIKHSDWFSSISTIFRFR